MEKRFSVPLESHMLIGDSLSKDAQPPSVLVLHGAGQATRERYRKLREFLFEHDVSSAAFDFVGHGETGGEMASSSLAHRVAEASSVIESQRLQEPLTVIAASMGSYVTLKLIQLFNVEKIIFFVPAMYDKAAYTIPFDAQFSKALRKEKSWQNSDAWDILKTYTGKLLVIGAEFDQTVPRELTEKIVESAVQANEKELYFVPGASHLLMQFLEANPEELRLVYNKILKFIR